jgi:hypothetical protein
MNDWGALVPETGAGLLETHVQASPPLPPPWAPAGIASSTQTTSGVLVPGFDAVFEGVVAAGAADLPVASHVTRPPYGRAIGRWGRPAFR